MLDSIEGTCVVTPMQIKTRMDAVQTTLDELTQQITVQEKKMVASYIIKAVTLTRNYGIQVEFNISEAQYLGGMEM